MELNVEQRNLIRVSLERKFSLDELKTLAFDIGLDYEDIPHDRKGQLSREIIQLCIRKEIVDQLLKLFPIDFLDERLLQLLQDLNASSKKTNKRSKNKADESIRVVVADSWGVVRKGLRAYLALDTTLRVVGEARDKDECVGLLSALKPDVVLVDLEEMRPFHTNAVHVLRSIKLASPDTRILVLTSVANPLAVSAVLQFGVAGYLTKDTDASSLAESIRLVHRGLFLLSSLASSHVSLTPVSLF